jgi:hypothetical protein
MSGINAGKIKVYFLGMAINETLTNLRLIHILSGLRSGDITAFFKIISLTHLPVAGARLMPIMECPVAKTIDESCLVFPINGIPSGVHGRYPYQIFSGLEIFNPGIITR